MNNQWNQLPTNEYLDKTVKALEENGFNPIVVDSEEEAKEKALSLIPKGAEVITMTSETLRSLGLEEYINTSGEYDAVKPKIYKMDRATQGKEIRHLFTTPDFAIGSVHAVTEDGHVLIASRTGSQLPAYAFGAGKVIWVVGAQKIVKDIEEGKKRIFDYVLDLEGERANKAYNITGGSKVNKLVTYYQEETPQRVTIILVKKSLGF